MGNSCCTLQGSGHQELEDLQLWKPIMDNVITDAAKRGRFIASEHKKREKYIRVWSEASQLAAAKAIIVKQKQLSTKKLNKNVSFYTDNEMNTSEDEAGCMNDQMEQCLVSMQRALGKRNARDAALRAVVWEMRRAIAQEADVFGTPVPDECFFPNQSNDNM